MTEQACMEDELTLGGATPDAGHDHRPGLDRAVVPRRTGLQFPRQIPLTSWERIGRQLSLIADSSAWWLGDWLVYGQDHYTDRYRTAIERTALDYQTLRNYAWVARRFSLPRRRDKLSFAHHAEVAALSEADQDLWLERADRHRWSRNRLRRELRQAQTEAKAVRRQPAAAPADLNLRPSREQLERWELAARIQDCDLTHWMVQGLETLAEEVINRNAARSTPPAFPPSRPSGSGVILYQIARQEPETAPLSRESA
ncbi:hypothetical protein SAMN05421505_11126 [Sinosporangium album]|uniref:LmbU n=1 Tax=Sinosporangium album TaxID=504805 RepID=A0A1G7ZGG2_9ACTN|nr:LmbU family transcriptional regulator [Sinosporangium album]SDH07190.1 hypothetical protein SAMN05421505_11126 [Sinosporangium album]